MSSEPYVRARGLGKKFKLYDHPWQRLADVGFGISRGRDHWALRDVDLDLRMGDCVGIVGRNGAGKSTLLELICGILQPSEGVVETHGRIAALLQLGAGFNPEFSGRENVFLGASLYGLSTEETRARFAAIEAFAGIGDYIDRPVREYSSGMYARLAFSVCAHVDAEILVVDEILGVGDVRFQQKSMRFLRSFRKRGLILFVSHNEHAVAAICRTGVWIDGGRVAATGTTKQVLYRYRREMSRLRGPDHGFVELGEVGGGETDGGGSSARASSFEGGADRGLPEFHPDDAPEPTDGGAIVATRLAGEDGLSFAAARGGETLKLTVTCRALLRLEHPHVCFALRNPMGQVVFSGDSRDFPHADVAALEAGDEVEVQFRFRLPFLPTANYPIEVFFLCEEAGALSCLARVEAAVIVQMLSQHVSDGAANVAMDDVVLLVGSEVAAT